MNRLPVESSNIVSIGYDEASLVLEIEFKGGRVYQYQSVPEDVFRELMSAGSIGKTFHSSVRGKFDFIKLDV